MEDLRRPRDIFTELSFLVQEKRTTLRSLLDQHNSGVALSRSDLAGVLDSLIRNVTEPELHYFQVRTGAGLPTYSSFTLPST